MSDAYPHSEAEGVSRRTDESTVTVLNPWTGQPVETIAACSSTDLDWVVGESRRALATWSKVTPSERAEVLLRVADALEADIENLARTEAEGAGRPVTLARRDVLIGIDALRSFAGAMRSVDGGGATEFHKGYTSLARREALGVVGVIAPWSYSLLFTIIRTGAAVVAGNTVVLHPAQETPLSAVRVQQLLADVLPPGVFQVVPGLRGELVPHLLAHRGIDAVTVDEAVLTMSGDDAIGRIEPGAIESKRVMIDAVTKNTGIVHEDADVLEAVDALLLSAFSNSGQDRGAPGRFLVHEKVFELFMQEVSEAIEGIAVGDPLLTQTGFGPLASRAQQMRVFDLIGRARAEGGVIVRGGEGGAPYGFFVQPTVILGDHRSELARTPVLGPVVFVQKFSSDDDAVQIANELGPQLTASVFTQDVRRALDLIGRLDARSSWVNTHLPRVMELPWGAFDPSSDPRENGSRMVQRFSRIKHVTFKL